MINHWIREASRVAVVELASPKNRNALSLAMLENLQKVIKDLSHSKEVRVIILQSQGNVFSSGHDLKEVKGLIDANDNAKISELFRCCSDTMQTIVTSPTPVIAKVKGMATAAGCQLVASCDLAYADLDAKFATPGVNIGLFCSTPAVALSRSVGRKQAMEMLLTGRPISATKAQSIGLINEAFPADELDAHVDEIATLIAGKSPQAILMGKPTFVEQLPLTLTKAYEVAGETMCANAVADECREGIEAFLEKRPANW